MTAPFVTHAFIAGELAPSFYGRTDLEKYDLGVALARNFLVDFRGGLKTRPGFQFLNYLRNARFFPFFVGEGSNDILVAFSEEGIYFFSGGEPLVEAAIDITDVDIHPTTGVIALTLTSVAGLSVGMYLLISGQRYTYRINSIVGVVIRVEILNGMRRLDNPATATSITPLTVLPSPYLAQNLPGLRAHFRLDRLVITHPLHPPREIVINTSGQFTIDAINFASRVLPPTGFSAKTYEVDGDTSTATEETGDAQTVFIVTSIDDDENESVSSAPFLARDLFNYTTGPGSLTLSWTPRANAVKYRVYRSIIAENEDIILSQPVGYIGETVAPQFVDNNIIPDYTIQPPQFFNPFAAGAVLEINVVNGGTDYAPDTTTIAITGGTGFQGYPIVINGSIVSVVILNGGGEYTTSSAITVTGDGSGAELEVSFVSPTAGRWPRVSTTFQQRRLYAGTNSLPLTVFGSKPGSPNNFDSGSVVTDGDAYTFAIDAEEATPIKHLLPVRDGLLIMHGRGIDRLHASEGRAVTPLNRVVERQASFGVGDPPPADINNDVLVVTQRGTALIAMGYTFYTNSYSPQDISILASHLFSSDAPPVRMEWVEEPDKTLWVLKADGKLLALTYMKEQEIYAWTQHETDGFVREICAIRDTASDVLYALIEREGNFCVEKLAVRRPNPIEQYIGSDSSLRFIFSSPVTSVENLWHLEGREVQVLADGDALGKRTVIGGTVELENSAKVVVIGLPFVAEGLSLPLSSPEMQTDGKRKRVVGTAVRLYETRGLEIGTRGGPLYEMKDKGWEDWGEVTELRSDNSLVLHATRWERDAQLHFRQRYPLPATVLGFVTKAEIEG